MKTLALLVLFAAGSARADTWSIDAGSETRWLGDTSAAILTSENLTGPRITVGRRLLDLDGPRGRTLDVGVFGRWVFATAAGQIFQSLDTETEQHAFTGGLRVDAPLVRRIRLVGQLELGGARTAVVVREGDTMTPVDDHAWGFLGAVSLGTDLALVERRRFRLGVVADLGYTVTDPVQIHAYPGNRPADMQSIPTLYASIGNLDTRGWTFAFALRGGF
jgi:hypothetical protein